MTSRAVNNPRQQRSERRSPLISILVAMSENRVIGRGGALPWRLSDDLKRFKRLTTGHPIIMGRKTFDSIGRKPLPDRLNIVITRQTGCNAQQPGVVFAHSLDEALELAICSGAAQDEFNRSEIFIIGGESVFIEALARASRIYLTEVHTMIENGDVYFPSIDLSEWRDAEPPIALEADDRNEFAQTFRVLTRVD